MRHRNTKISFGLIALTLLSLHEHTGAQIESPSLSFNRGMLWQSVFFGKIGPNFSNWGRKGIGLDWPGFDDTWIRDDIGGPASHMVSGGFLVGCKKTNDSVLAVEDWSMYAGTISSESNAKYKITKHTKKYKNGENWWLKMNPKEGEEVIETSWEYNLNYSNVDDRERSLPVRVTRTMHQWSGSRRDENYIIYEYVVKNIAPELRAQIKAQNLDSTRYKIADTLYQFYMTLNYALQSNSRAWNVLFPTRPGGAANTYYYPDLVGKQTIFGWARDYRETYGVDETFGYSGSQGRIIDGKPNGEFLAPGFVGLRVLYSSPNINGLSTIFTKFGYSAASNSIDLSGPFANKGTLESKYDVVRDPANAPNFIQSPTDTVYMGRSRLWTLIPLGPWNILPGDSITIAVAEIVDGMDTQYSIDKVHSEGIISTLGTQGRKIFDATVDKSKFTYDQYRNPATGLLTGKGFNHPDPPAAPRFTTDFYRGKEKFAATVIQWETETEALPDPDDGTDDLYGYRLYRSDHLPIGPWYQISSIRRGDPQYLNSATNKYSFVDSSGDIGTNYYYALTAYDTGKASWSLNPSAIFPETGSNKVPPLESSLFANRTTLPFKMTIKPLATLNEILVVPNPYIIKAGYSQPGAGDEILFTNLPNPCTIRIYTVRGDLVKTIDVPDGYGGIASWDQITDYGQFVESGIYIFHVDSPLGTKIGKLAIIR